MAVGFGLKAIERGYRVLFTTAAAMLTTLTKALSEGRFDDKLKIYTIPRLLIIDEIGYLPIDRQAATLFFQLISPALPACGKSRAWTRRIELRVLHCMAWRWARDRGRGRRHRCG